MPADRLRDSDSRRRPDGRGARRVRARARPHPIRGPLRRHPRRLPPTQLDEFQPDLILSDYTLPRFDGMAALSPGARAGARVALPDRHRLGQRGDRRRLHEGRGDRLPAQEQPGPHRPRDRGGAGPGRRPARRRRARSRPSAARRPTSGPSSTPACRPSCWWTATAPSRRSTPPREDWAATDRWAAPADEGDAIRDFIPDAAESFQAALGGEARTRRALPARSGRDRALVRDDPCAGGGRARRGSSASASTPAT